MEAGPDVQIHQQNDSEILEFFNAHQVKYRLIGDHLFIIRSRGRDIAAGPGDRLSLSSDGEVDVTRGDHRQRAHRMILTARKARRHELRAGRAVVERLAR